MRFTIDLMPSNLDGQVAVYVNGSHMGTYPTEGEATRNLASDMRQQYAEARKVASR